MNTVPTATQIASLQEAGSTLPDLAGRARRDGVTTVLVDEAHGGEQIAALVPLRMLDEVTDARIREVARRAELRGADDEESTGIAHAEAMAALGLDEHGLRSQAA